MKSAEQSHLCYKMAESRSMHGASYIYIYKLKKKRKTWHKRNEQALNTSYAAETNFKQKLESKIDKHFNVASEVNSNFVQEE